ncbi:hypothetical protein [Sphingosinicella terrae]|uniref:hypothetical protein n=1 Tax=Sphingosinicella terrae TaxID=2172047 RepID=UPI0013B3D32D|nr:hypothetical protein [Sphingosinicella terrae]
MEPGNPEKKIVEENILGKRPQSARLGSVLDMAAIYALDTLPPITRAALAFWNSAENPSLLLGALAVARDPILRASAAVILAAKPGEAISFREMAKCLESLYPRRFSASTLRAVGERVRFFLGADGTPLRRPPASANDSAGGRRHRRFRRVPRPLQRLRGRGGPHIQLDAHARRQS